MNWNYVICEFMANIIYEINSLLAAFAFQILQIVPHMKLSVSQEKN